MIYVACYIVGEYEEANKVLHGYSTDKSRIEKLVEDSKKASDEFTERFNQWKQFYVKLQTLLDHPHYKEQLLPTDFKAPKHTPYPEPPDLTNIPIERHASVMSRYDMKIKGIKEKNDKIFTMMQNLRKYTHADIMEHNKTIRDKAIAKLGGEPAAFSEEPPPVYFMEEVSSLDT